MSTIAQVLGYGTLVVILGGVVFAALFFFFAWLIARIFWR